MCLWFVMGEKWANDKFEHWGEAELKIEHNDNIYVIIYIYHDNIPQFHHSNQLSFYTTCVSFSITLFFRISNHTSKYN